MCGICGEERWIAEFRILSSGLRSAYDQDCDYAYGSARKRKPGLKVSEFLAQQENERKWAEVFATVAAQELAEERAAELDL